MPNPSNKLGTFIFAFPLHMAEETPVILAAVEEPTPVNPNDDPRAIDAPPVESPADALVQIAVRIMDGVTKGDFAFTRHLLESGNPAAMTAVLAAEDEQGRTVLHWAALCGDEGMVKILLAKLGEVGARGKEYIKKKARDTQQTALHWATIKGHMGVLWQLRRAGADLRARDSLGATVAALAVQHEHLETLLLLLHWDERLGEPADVNGCSPVHWAAYKGDVNALRALHFLQGGAGFKELDCQGMSAVHRAVNSYPCVQFLVSECFVDPSLTNNQGRGRASWPGMPDKNE
jgi:hypothetical protein